MSAVRPVTPDMAAHLGPCIRPQNHRLHATLECAFLGGDRELLVVLIGGGLVLLVVGWIGVKLARKFTHHEGSARTTAGVIALALFAAFALGLPWGALALVSIFGE
jgi:hypothetical protein